MGVPTPHSADDKPKRRFSGVRGVPAAHAYAVGRGTGFSERVGRVDITLMKQSGPEGGSVVMHAAFCQITAENSDEGRSADQEGATSSL